MRINIVSNNKGWLLFLLILIIHTQPLFAIYRIFGSVSDSLSHEPLSYTSVYIIGTTDGCMTDNNGNFSFLTQEKKGVIVISAIGYQEKRFLLTDIHSFPLTVSLSPATYALKEIEIKPKREKYSRKNNPAVDFVKHIIDHREQYRLDNHSYYSRDRHELFTIAMNNFDKNPMQKDLLGRIGLLENYLDTSLVSGKPILNLSSKELIGTDYYRKTPKSHKKYIDGRRRAGIDDSFSVQEIDVVIEETFKDVDIFQNDILLFRNNFTSPLSTIGPLIYKYYLLDTLYVGEEQCVDLAFVPFNSESYGFTGHLYVTLDSTYFIKWVQMNVPHDINVNFISYLNITQKFSRASDGTPLLDSESLVTEFEITSEINGIYSKREVNYNNYSFEEPTEKSIFDRKEPIIENEKAYMRDENYWASNRIGYVSPKEKSVAQMMEELRNYPLYYWTEKTLMFIFTGYIPNKKERPEFFYGPVNTTISHNELEGLRIRTGGMTSAYLNPHLMGRYFIAYGVDDKRLKYMGELEYSFKKKKEHINEFPIHSLRLHSENDIFQYGQTYLYTNKDNVFLNLKRMPNNQLGYLRKNEFSYNREYYSGFSFSAVLRNRIDESTRLMKFEQVENGVSHFAKELRQTELEIKLRYAPHERFQQTKWNRHSLLPEHPVFTLSHSIALKGLLGSEYTCQHTEASFRKRFMFSSFGYTDCILRGGKVWNSVPYPLLIIPNANLSYTIQKESFALMNPMEFITDKYVSWDATCYMNGTLFNRIPLLRKLGWREVINCRGFWGGLTPSNIPNVQNSDGLYLFPSDNHLLTSRPYIEGSIGIENIFKVLQVDYVYRFTYRNSPNIDKNGIRIRMHMQF